jgi:Protein of unknown function (DUF4235)
MSKKSDSSNSRLVTTMAVTGGLFLLRKVLIVVWTKATGREPPVDVTDPKVTLPEALAWAVGTAVILEAARFAIVRKTMRRPAVEGDSPAESN